MQPGNARLHSLILKHVYKMEIVVLKLYLAAAAAAALGSNQLFSIYKKRIDDDPTEWL